MSNGNGQGSDHSGNDNNHGGGNPGQGGGNPGGGGGDGNSGPGGGPKKFEIQIDRQKYEVTLAVMTGAQLRAVPPGGIPADRDLFEVVPGAPDKKIANDELVQIRSGLRFFTAPGQINPGAIAR